MTAGNRITRLLALAERELNNTRAAPAKDKFKGLRLDLGRLDADWERRRGEGVRLAAFLLRDDSDGLYRKARADLDAFEKSVPWLKREASQLRKSAKLIDKAAARVSTVLVRVEREQATPSSGISHAPEVQHE